MNPTAASPIPVAIVGGGPAGLAAAEVLAAGGLRCTLFDQKPSVGRKFLVAGSGGLNLTNAEPHDAFLRRYSGPPERWRALLAESPPEAIRAWAASLGIETFAGSGGKVFPIHKQAAPLLRRWLQRLRSLGVEIQVRRRWSGISRNSAGGWELEFDHAGARATRAADRVVLALGGASWPETGSDAAWVPLLAGEGVALTPFGPANCGFEVAWPAEVVAVAAGAPLKNVAAASGGKTVTGECLITRYGIEGGAIYHLGPEIRQTGRLTLDLKPTFSAEALAAKLGNTRRHLEQAKYAWKLSPAAFALLHSRGPWRDAASLAAATKAFEIDVAAARPVAEAISSTGGIQWDELDESLMLRKMPGVYAAGEMIDWEAPTGGFLLQGCWAMGRWVGKRILAGCQPDLDWRTMSPPGIEPRSKV